MLYGLDYGSLHYYENGVPTRKVALQTQSQINRA